MSNQPEHPTTHTSRWSNPEATPEPPPLPARPEVKEPIWRDAEPDPVHDDEDQRWPISPKLREAIMTQLAMIIANPKEKSRTQVAAIRAVADLDRINATRDAEAQAEGPSGPTRLIVDLRAMDILRMQAMEEHEVRDILDGKVEPPTWMRRRMDQQGIPSTAHPAEQHLIHGDSTPEHPPVHDSQNTHIVGREKGCSLA